jgi:hypothetical protein
VAGAGSPALAQAPFGGNLYQPPVSPYLNILRAGAPPGLNYYNIVQPQFQFGNQISQLQMNQQQLAGAALGTTTGHPVQFGSYLHYYSRGIGVGTGTFSGGYRVGLGAGGTLGGGLQAPSQLGSPGGLGRAPAVPSTSGR